MVKEVLNAVSIGVEAIAECEISTVGTNFKALCGRIVEGVAIAHSEIIYFLFVFYTIRGGVCPCCEERLERL